MYRGLGCLGAFILGVIAISGLVYGSGFIVFLGFVGAIASVVIGLYFDDKEIQEFSESLVSDMDYRLKVIKDFTPTQKFYAPDRESMIAIDLHAKKICIIENRLNNKSKELSPTVSEFDYDSYVFNYSDIIQAQILIDGQTVTETSRGSQIGGAIIGGVLAGGVGAIIGGLSGSKTSSEKIKKIQLQIVVNDSSKSFYRVTFGHFPDGVSKDNDEYIEADRKVTHWYNLLSLIIKKDVEESQEEQDTRVESNQTLSSSVADELRKLNELKNEGIITEEEFIIQKQKLLSK